MDYWVKVSHAARVFIEDEYSQQEMEAYAKRATRNYCGGTICWKGFLRDAKEEMALAS